MFNSRKMKKCNIKEIIPLIIHIVLTIAMVFFIEYGYTDFVEPKEINFSNNILSTKWEEKEGITEYTIEVSESPLFFNSTKEKVTSTEYISEDISLETFYVRIKPVAEGKRNLFAKVYKIYNHEHHNILNTELSVAPGCETEGFNIYNCEECDNTVYETLEMLGHDYYVIGYKGCSCTEDGYTSFRCDRCGICYKEPIPKVDHVFQFVKTLEKSTCIKQGTSLYSCVGCGEEKTEILPYGSHSYYYAGESVNGGTIYVSHKCSICGKGTSKSFGMQYTGSYTGVFAIPSFNYYLPIYQGYAQQAIVDAANSGCVLVNFSVPVIGDHAHQGFSVTKKAVPGSTVMYYAGQKYICSSNFNGLKSSYDLTNLDGVSIASIPASLYTYTCNDWSGRSVRIVGWNRV